MHDFLVLEIVETAQQLVAVQLDQGVRQRGLLARRFPSHFPVKVHNTVQILVVVGRHKVEEMHHRLILLTLAIFSSIFLFYSLSWHFRACTLRLISEIVADQIQTVWMVQFNQN